MLSTRLELVCCAFLGTPSFRPFAPACPRPCVAKFILVQGNALSFLPKFVFTIFYIDTGQKGLRCDAMRHAAAFPPQSGPQLRQAFLQQRVRRQAAAVLLRPAPHPTGEPSWALELLFTYGRSLSLLTHSTE